MKKLEGGTLRLPIWNIRPRECGSILIYTTILVTVAVFLAVSFLGSREEWLRGQNRRLIRTFFELDSDIQLNQVKNYIQSQLAATLSLDPSGIVGSNGPLANNTQSGLTFNGIPIELYNYAATTSPATVISVSPFTTPATRLQPLTYPATSLFDPLYGASAVSNTFNITQNASAVSPGETEYSNRQRVTRVDIRQVPLSSFSFFSNTSTLINAAYFPNGVGRAHVEGQATIAGHVGGIYPFTATGPIQFASGATLTAQRAPTTDSIPHTADATSTVNDLKGAFENTIVDQDVNNSHQVIPPNIINPQLIGQCQIAIFHSKGLTPDQDTFNVVPQNNTSAATAAFIGTKLTIDQTSWLSTHFAAIRIIQFDFNNYRGLGVNSYYVTSPDKTAVLLIKNAGVLGGDLSIVTDLAVWVSNGFNDGTVTSGSESDTIYGTQPGYNPSLYAASIVTSRNVVGVNTGP